MMNWVVAKIRWILLVTGASTCALLYAAFEPAEAVDLFFDWTLEGPLDQIFVQGWAALVGIVGALMVYGAFAQQVRTLAMVVAGSSKLTFLGLMLAYGQEYLDEKVSLVLAVDALTVALFGTFAVGILRARRGGRAPRPLAAPRQPEPGERSTASVQGDEVPAPVPTQPRMIVAAGKRLGHPSR